MSAIPKRKLCWHCEGDVSSEEDNCPYCGVYLHGDPNVEEHSSLFANYLPQPTSSFSENDPESDDKDVLLAPVAVHFFKVLCLCLISFNLICWGFVLLLFGQSGSFTLHWDTSYWYLYLLAALPLAYASWRMLASLEESE